ncbi:MAG: DNA replication/repair protein RecF [Paracoccaceae bacterium]
MPTTYIRQLRLSHFRSHKAAHLDLDGRPVVLYGANGAGKTNVLEALSLLSPGRGLRRADSAELMRRPETLGWRIDALLRADGRDHALASRATPGQPRTVEIDGKPAPQTALGQLMRVLWLVPAMDRLWTDGSAERRRFIDRLALSFNPAHAEATLIYEKAMRERNRLLKDQVRDAAWYEALEHQMAQSGAAISQTRNWVVKRLARAQDGAATTFPVAQLAINPGDDTPDDDLATVLARGRSRDMAAGRTLSGPHRADLQAVYAEKSIAAHLCSTGEQKALLISLVLAAARALLEDTGATPLLLLDEVAAHLDATRRAALYDEICTLGAQAWMTGTGAELFEDLGERAMQFEVSERDGASQLRVQS